jgi:hypothetical protein
MNTIKLLIAVCIIAGISACSKIAKSGDQNSKPKVTTQIQIEAEIFRTLRYDGYTQLNWSVSVLDNAIPVNSAIVTINGVNIPRTVGFINGWYSVREYETPKPSYIPGQNYTVSVLYNGKTYTESEKAPGGITANSDFTKIQWEYNSKYATLSVRHLYGSTTHSVQNTSTIPSVLNSPQTIPSTAYPSPGDYIVNISLQNIKSESFGTLSGDRCYLNIEDFREWKITK